MTLDTKTLLQTPIADTALTKELISFFQTHQYKNLHDILQHNISIIRNKPGFTTHMLHDYLEFLKTNNLAHLLKE